MFFRRDASPSRTGPLSRVDGSSSNEEDTLRFRIRRGLRQGHPTAGELFEDGYHRAVGEFLEWQHEQPEDEARLTKIQTERSNLQNLDCNKASGCVGHATVEGGPVTGSLVTVDLAPFTLTPVAPLSLAGRNVRNTDVTT